MLDLKTMMKGMGYLQTIGLEQKEEWAIAVWLDILNEKGDHISEAEKVHMNPEEYVNACKYLAARHKSFYPGDNIPALLLERVETRRNELKRIARKKREDQAELEDKAYRQKRLAEHKSGGGEFKGFGKVDFKEIVNERQRGVKAAG